MLLLLALLCRDGLAWFARQYPDATPAELLLLLRDGILLDRLPWGHARQQLFEGARTQQAQEKILAAKPPPKSITNPAPIVKRLDFQRAWQVLTDEERRVISLSMDGFEGKALAAELGLSPDAARQQLVRARSRLKQLMGGI